MSINIYTQVIELEIEHDHHCSDLYIPVNDQTIDLINNYEFKCNVTRFISQIDGKQWFDIPFSYYPPKKEIQS